MSEPKRVRNSHFEDSRGAFVKLYSAEQANFEVKQINHVTNLAAGILRGLHMQKAPYSEAKRFTVTTGAIQLVCFCLDKTSAYCAKTFSFKLIDSTESVDVPRGFATGYLVLEENTTIVYQSDNDYVPTAEIGVRWDDPILRVNWEMEPSNVSGKDRSWENLSL